MLVGFLPTWLPQSLSSTVAAPEQATAMASSVRPDLGEIHRRYQGLTRSEDGQSFFSQGALFGGVPFLGMDWATFGGIVVAAGVTTLLLRGIQNFWQVKNKPFGSLEDLNHIVRQMVVIEPFEAENAAWLIGGTFVKRVRKEMGDYDQAYFQVPYNVSPNEWDRIDDKRRSLTVGYIKSMVRLFQDFARGLHILSQGEHGHIYAQAFEEFSHKVFLVAGPMTRIEEPLSQEDVSNFEAFQSVLRSELRNLETKLGLVPATQAV